MALGMIWGAGLDGKWRDYGMPYVRTATGHVPAKYVWRHNGTTWVQVWARDDKPPLNPTVTATIKAGTKNVIDVRVANDSHGPIKRTVIKVSWDGVQPANPGTVDKYYFSQTTPGGTGGGSIPEEWSEYWKGYKDAAGYSGSKSIPASYQTFTIPLSTTVKISAWARDENFNWSSAGTDTIKTLSPAPPPPTLKEVDVRVRCSDAGQWSNNHHAWTTSGNQNGYAGQGGEWALEGYWFYNGNLKAPLAKMVKGLEMKVFIHRLGDEHGVKGDASINVGVHRHRTKPASDPTISSSEYGSDLKLKRGESAWWKMDTGWMDNFQSGDLDGVAIGRGVGYTSYSSSRYAKCYGRGTHGGEVYMRWNQY